MMGLDIAHWVLVAILLLLLIWGLFGSFIVAYIARKKGRGSGVGWFLVSLLFTPVFAVLCLIALPHQGPVERD